MLRVLFLSVVVVLAVLAALPAQASALSCAYSNPAAGVHYSNVVFEGVAQPGPTDDRGYLYTPATFKVNRYLKGSGSSQRKVTTGRNSDPEEPSIAGGVDAKPGETWTIYGRVVGGVVEAGYCDPTHRGRATRPTPRPTGLEPGRSIAGAALGIGFESALQLLGPNPRGAGSPSRPDRWEWTYSARRLRVLFNEDGRIRSLSTSSDRYRTEENIGVGSSEHRLRLKFPRVECRAVSSKTRSCVLAGVRGRATDFRIRERLVYRATVALPAPSRR